MPLELNTLNALLLLLVGLILLWKAADSLVAASVDLASRLGISPLVIGLTIVAMGTSAPEVAASIYAAVKNAGPLAIGNVYGSNIANLALVGGLCAIIRPLRVQTRIIKREIPAMLITALLLWPFLHNLYLTRLEGTLLLILFTLLIIITVIAAKTETKLKPQLNETIKDNINKEIKLVPKTITTSIIILLFSLAGLTIGAHLSITGAVFIGEKAGLSQTVIGLTIIAFGTSLPELATSLTAAVKGHHDISIGNLVGSNIFNTLLVTGSAGLIKPFEISPRLIGTDYWVMIAVTITFIIMAIFGKKISRKDGIVLTTAYFAYMTYLLIATPSS